MREYLVITYKDTWRIVAPVPVMWLVVAWLKARAWVTGIPSETHVYSIR